jgi:HK97 family phage major capsid protein
LSTESTQITASNQVFQQVSLSPKTVAAFTVISRQLALQSSPSAEAVVMNDLAAVLAVAMDLAAIAGTASGGQPQGIIGTAGVGSVTGTSLAYDDLLEFQSDVLTSLALINPAACGYLTTTAIAAALAFRQKFTGTDATLWQGNIAQGVLAGFPAFSTDQVPTGDLVFGDWSQLLIGEWGILELMSDPFTNFATARIGIRAFLTCDIALRHPASFSVATSIT